MVGRQVRFPEYENWLEEIAKHGGEYNWVMQERDFPLNMTTGCQRERTVSEINDSVLMSRVVQETIESEALRRQCPQSDVYHEAVGMLADMTHGYNLSWVRGFGYAVAKIFNRIFDGIYINSAQMRNIREITKSSPVIFMPTHRTYLDFLLVSLMCFQYEIALPAIAAGQDFRNMAVMGTVLRKSGAFFMRRSFGKDKLYWAVFSQYVQTHITNSDRTMEFFVEGTRSRVGKSLHPKYGLIQIVVEPFLKGEIYDMTVVPVTMNYDKILEEMLYAYELLGFSKPKESTSGLFKAREVLDKSFGKCFMTFGEPISVRQHFGSQLLRSSFVCPPMSQFTISSKAKSKIRNFAHEIVVLNNSNNVITVWPLACLTMLQKLDRDDESSFRFSEIQHGVDQLIVLLKKLDIHIHQTDGIEEELKYYIRLHEDLFRPTNLESGDFQLRLLDQPVEKSGSVRREIMERAVSRLVLTTYSNLIVEAMMENCYLALAIDRLGIKSQKELQSEFQFLQNLLKREFVFVPGEESNRFKKALRNLQKAEIISLMKNGEVEVSNPDGLHLLTKIAMPYIAQFYTVLDTVIQLRNDLKNVNQVIKSTQNSIVRLYELGAGIPVRLSFLSTEPIKNNFNTLIDLGCISKREAGLEFSASRLEELYSRLSRYTKYSGVVEVFSFSPISAKM